LEAGVGFGFEEATTGGDAEGDGVADAMGVEPQADASRAVTASAPIQLGLFMSCSGNGPAGD
jgi:hypothetical protein